jgi:hypothetical protein
LPEALLASKHLAVAACAIQQIPGTGVSMDAIAVQAEKEAATSAAMWNTVRRAGT